MKRALVFQHMDYDHPGRFLDFFSEDGIVPELVRLWEGQEIPNLAPYDFLFVLGGAQDTWQENEHTWMPAEKAAIREWVWDRAKPYLGVCLGHQLLCDALGGEVALAAEPEVGVFDVSLTPDGQEHGLFAGLESLKLGHGGDRRLAELLGLNEETVARGRRDLVANRVLAQGVRRAGGGRPTVEKKRPTS